MSILHAASLNTPMLYPFILLVSRLDITLTSHLDDANREQFLGRPKMHLHRHRAAGRGGKLIRPSLARSLSEPTLKTWPGAKKPKRVSPWDIHRELEELVIASTTDDSDDEDEKDNERGFKSADGEGNFLPTQGWKRKGARELWRERRARSEEAASQSLSM